MTYKATFLIPKSSKKCLSDCGWEFQSNDRLSDRILTAIINRFGLIKEDEYEGVTDYRSRQVKVSVIRDHTGAIEQIYLQLFGLPPSVIQEMFSGDLASEVEVFVP
jgi:hypothetical protein